MYNCQGHYLSSVSFEKRYFFSIFLVVTQNYDCYVNQAHVIRGNDVLMKCDIPSFVTDFVTLQNWQDNEENIISPYSSNGTFKRFFCKEVHHHLHPQFPLVLHMLHLKTFSHGSHDYN